MEALEFNVSNLVRQEVGARTAHSVSATEVLSLEDADVRNIQGTVQLSRTNFGILVRAKLAGTVRLECDRCLESYDSTLSVDFTEEFLPVVDVASGRPVQSERTDETFFITPNHVADLTEAARQYFLLQIPMHKLCRENCLGLCPICGVNKNVRECRCVPETESPLAGLAILLTDQM